MLKILTKYDYREQFCDALRNSKLKQCRKGFFKTGPGGSLAKACALGIAIEAGLLKHNGNIFDGPNNPESCLGKFDIDAYEVSRRNDAGQTFAEIADWIEEQP